MPDPAETLEPEVAATASELAAIDFDSLLTPISADQPTGESLRYEGTYDRIEELRREDDARLPQGVWKHELKRAEWPQVLALCLESLETRSKDLRIAGWLLEALFHLHGLPGLLSGFELVTGLCESFWEDLHPQIEDGDLAMRLAPLLWIDDKLTVQLKRTPITRPQGSDAAPHSLAQWERALYLSNLARTEPAAAKSPDAQEEASQAKIEVGVTLTPDRFYQGLRQDLGHAEERRRALADLLAELVAEDPPSFWQTQQVLDSLRGFADNVLAQRAVEAGGDPAADAADAAGAAGTGGDLGLSDLGDDEPIRNRAAAYRQLSLAADYLMRTEPHSPAPYLVKRAVSWGNMPLAELFKELMQGGADLKTIYTLLGIKSTE